MNLDSTKNELARNYNSLPRAAKNGASVPRFTVKELMMAMAMFAVGLTLFAIATNRDIPDPVRAGLIGGGGMTIGTGIAMPLKKSRWLGLAIGTVITIVALNLILPPR